MEFFSCNLLTFTNSTTLVIKAYLTEKEDWTYFAFVDYQFSNVHSLKSCTLQGKKGKKVPHQKTPTTVFQKEVCKKVIEIVANHTIQQTWATLFFGSFFISNYIYIYDIISVYFTLFAETFNERLAICLIIWPLNRSCNTDVYPTR